jgi:uridine kinase
MPRRVSRDEAIDAIARLARTADTAFVGIDGPGAAGKSKLARDAVAVVPGAVVVQVDAFSGRSVPEWDWERFDSQVAVPLLAGRAARYQAWNWDDDEPGEWHTVEPGRVVIVEGVSATRRDVRLPWALTIWVDAPAPLRLRRALERDGAAMLSTWVEEWIPSEDAYIARERPQQRVDLLVAGY